MTAPEKHAAVDKMAAPEKVVPEAAETWDELPVSTLRDAVPFLRRPFTAEAVKFKVQTVFGGGSGCLVVAYVDARLVIERLNRVIPDGWAAGYAPVDGRPNLMWCFLTVGGVTRQDVGESSKGMSKDLVSDALKRAAVHFGVAVSVYALPQIRLKAGTPHLEKRKAGQKDTLVLTEYGHRKLRDGYAAWLVEHGVPKFGAPLDHGDVEGETVQVDEPEQQFEPEAPPALDDEKAQKLREAIHKAYDNLRALGDSRGVREVPPAQFQAWLAQTAHSHAEMYRLLKHLNDRCEQIQAAEGAEAKA